MINNVTERLPSSLPPTLASLPQGTVFLHNTGLYMKIADLIGDYIYVNLITGYSYAKSAFKGNRPRVVLDATITGREV